jgi:hypothetical protein
MERESVEVTDIALAGFLVTYCGHSPHKITTDVSEPFESVFFFKISPEVLRNAKSSYDDSETTVANLRAYVNCVRDLQAKAAKADAGGGILHL